jgi:hypothetical protein
MRDLRDAFVVHRLNAWSKRGADLRGMVPPLAAYMGLKGLTASERYLRLTTERVRGQSNILSPRRGCKRWGDDRRLMIFWRACELNLTPRVEGALLEKSERIAHLRIISVGKESSGRIELDSKDGRGPVLLAFLSAQSIAGR